jgi:pimeloyl-ACP methyl ester carboxylesterase
LKMTRNTYFAATILVFFLTSAAASVKTYKGKFADGATYIIQVPSNWNGTFVLYSHGYVAPGSSNPALDVGDPVTGAYLLANGYALGGSSYATTGWAVQQALPDQIEVLNKFTSIAGKPKRTVAWGHSLGGMITAGLIQRYPQDFDAALPMCGVLGGSVGTGNQGLDLAFAFYTLIAPDSGLQLVNITDPVKNLEIAENALAGAQNSAQGQARIALSAALDDVPGWYDPLSPEPAPTDYAAQEVNQYSWLVQDEFPFAFALRAEVEARAEGNFSWNNGVDYEKQLEASADYQEVVALYKAAGLSLTRDLIALKNAKRIRVNPPSLAYMKKNIIYNGEIDFPVLTLHTKADGLVVVESESAYKDVVDGAGHAKFLRQVFIHRAGHCEFTPAETVVAFEALINRLDTGTWPNLEAQELNNAAKALGKSFNILMVDGKDVHVGPRYFKFEPPEFLRPYDAGKQ